MLDSRWSLTHGAHWGRGAGQLSEGVTVRALVKQQAGPGLTLADVPDPAPGPTEVLVKVLRTGICGTDLHIEAWDDWAARTITAPLVVGHEFCGEVVALGDRWRRRRRPSVTWSPARATSCAAPAATAVAGRRHLCVRTRASGCNRDGAFAEYVVLPATNVWVHRIAGVDLDLAAIFDPFGNAVHTALMFPVLGEDVLITGAGPIGLMAAAVAVHAGARYVVVTDVRRSGWSSRASSARPWPSTCGRRRSPTSSTRSGMKEGFDVGLEMRGTPVALQDMIANMDHGGRIAMLGLPRAPIAVDWAHGWSPT